METASTVSPQTSPAVGPEPTYLLRYAAEVERWRQETRAARQAHA